MRGSIPGPESNAAAAPVPQIVVVLNRPSGERDADRIETPDRVLRLWAMLNAANDEIQATTVPPNSVCRLQHVLEEAYAELERSMSRTLVDEMHRLVPCGDTRAGLPELRIEYLSLVGWLGGLVMGMLSQLQAAGARQRQSGQPQQASAGALQAQPAMGGAGR